jgi:hypothetical protein
LNGHWAAKDAHIDRDSPDRALTASLWAGPTRITSSQAITVPGSYVLDNDITGGSRRPAWLRYRQAFAWIHIQASDVTLNLKARLIQPRLQLRADRATGQLRIQSLPYQFTTRSKIARQQAPSPLPLIGKIKPELPTPLLEITTSAESYGLIRHSKLPQEPLSPQRREGFLLLYEKQ